MNETQLKNAAKALGKLPSGLVLVCYGSKESPQGFLGSWIQQASFDPLQITLAIGKERAACKVLATSNTKFSLNILDKSSNHLMKAFFSKSPPFASIQWEWRDGFIYFPESLSQIQCETQAVFEAGDHNLVLANVVGGSLIREDAPLVHTRSTALSY